MTSRCSNGSNTRPTLQSQSANVAPGGQMVPPGGQMAAQVSPVISNQVHLGPHLTRQQQPNQQQLPTQSQQQSQQQKVSALFSCVLASLYEGLSVRPSVRLKHIL